MSKGIHSLDNIEPGDIYTTDGKDVWEVSSLSQRPTVNLRNLRTGETTCGAVGSPNVAEFTRLALPQGTQEVKQGTRDGTPAPQHDQERAVSNEATSPASLVDLYERVKDLPHKERSELLRFFMPQEVPITKLIAYVRLRAQAQQLAKEGTLAGAMAAVSATDVDWQTLAEHCRFLP